MKVISVVNTPFDSHMFIVSPDDQNCLIIDLGADFSVAKEVLDKENLTPCGVLFTHCHFDHVCGAKSAIDNGLDIYISKIDGELLKTEEGTLAKFVGVSYTPVDDYKILTEGENIIGGIKVNVIPTPGHTKGSLTFVIEDCMFTGDTLFCETVGRQDLPGGSVTDMKASVKLLISNLLEGKNYKVYPGHGKFTDLRHEYDYNPFVDKKEFFLK